MTASLAISDARGFLHHAAGHYPVWRSPIGLPSLTTSALPRWPSPFPGAALGNLSCVHSL